MVSHLSTDPVAPSGRFQLAMDELNYHSARLAHGVSQDKAEGTFQDPDKSSDLHLFTDEYISVKHFCEFGLTQRPVIYLRSLKGMKKKYGKSCSPTHSVQQ
jgi:hypothetical protein